MLIVTGAAGFIGSNLVDHLLLKGHNVVGIDNLSTGKMNFLKDALLNNKFKFINADLYTDKIDTYFKGCMFVFHLAANADVRFGTSHTRKDLEQNTIVTFNVLEAMRSAGCCKIAFSSTGSIYGEAKVIPTPEDCPLPIQTSLYGASKLACEGLIQAYCEGFGFQSWIFRLVSILGERYTHGHLYDFYNQLRNNPRQLNVLGDGLQRKSYLYVKDCISAIDIAINNSDEKVNIFNLGVDSTCCVNDSIRWISEKLSINPNINYAGGSRGWVGDNPLIHLNLSRIGQLGWKPDLSISQAVIRTIDYFQSNDWIFSDV